MVVGLAIVLIAAAALAVILFVDRMGNETGGPAVTPAAPAGTVEGVTVVPALTTNMRAAPTRQAELIAIIPGGRPALVTGQTPDGDWLRLVYPIGSQLEGWVPAANVVAQTGDVGGVDVVDVEAPGDASPASTTEVPAGATGGATLEPDLQVTSGFVAPNGTLTIRIANVGRGTFDAATSLRVTSAAGEVVGVVDIERTRLAPGRSATVTTRIAVRGTGAYVLEADWLDEVKESNEFNNTLRTLLVPLGQ